MVARPALVVLFAVVIAAGSACGDGGAEDTVQAPATAEAAVTVGQLCRAAGVASSGDAVTAAAAFQDAHAGVHAIADTLAKADDRDAAADVLRTKQQVEATATHAAANPASATTLATDLRALARSIGLATGVRVTCA
ncbi:MAG TPA: hypothetical protein VF230_06840 [Acidimicrobiales bacterium]